MVVIDERRMRNVDNANINYLQVSMLSLNLRQPHTTWYAQNSQHPPNPDLLLGFPESSKLKHDSDSDTIVGPAPRGPIVMALKDFLNAKNEKFDEFENPTAFEKDDCLSCRVIGMGRPKTM